MSILCWLLRLQGLRMRINRLVAAANLQLQMYIAQNQHPLGYQMNIAKLTRNFRTEEQGKAAWLQSISKASKKR